MKALQSTIGMCICVVLLSCDGTQQNNQRLTSGADRTDNIGQSKVADAESAKDVVKIAVGSPDHTTLVKAIQAAGLVDALSNAGPFTVFAPTNDAFAQLPEGTVENLLKPQNKTALSDVLYHHVQVSVYSRDRIASMSNLVMFDGKAEPVEVKGEDIYVGGAKILGEVRASNGIVYVVDKVILAD